MTFFAAFEAARVLCESSGRPVYVLRDDLSEQPEPYRYEYGTEEARRALMPTARVLVVFKPGRDHARSRT